MLVARPSSGDVLVFDSPVEGAEVGIIVAVLQHSIGPEGLAAECRVAYAVRTGRKRTEVRLVERWCSSERGDLYVRWYEGRGWRWRVA
jgi:hypothetical protein